MKNVKSEFNGEMNLMKMIGIVHVVVGHVSSKLMSIVREPYTFHMPLFYFVSGYFYNESHEKEKSKYIWTKFKKNVGLFYFYYILFIFLSFLISWKYNINIGDLNWYSFFIKPFTKGLGSPGFFMGSAWFILSLFLVQAGFILLFPLLKKILKSDVLILIFFGLIGYFSIYFSNKSWILNEYFLLISRTFIGMMFYYLGYFYKKNIENRFKIFNGRILTLLIILLSILTVSYKQISSVMLSGIYYGHNFIPIITALIGIYVSLFIAKGLNSLIKNEDDFLHLIGKNSFYIMIFHTFIFFILNLLYYKFTHISVYYYSSLTIFPFSTAFIDPDKLWPLYVGCGTLLPLFYGEIVKNLSKIKFKELFLRQKLGV